MTNTQYETECVKAAMGARKLAAVDAKINETEQALVYLLHERREIVNQYDLNKPTAIVDNVAAQIESLAVGGAA